MHFCFGIGLVAGTINSAVAVVVLWIWPPITTSPCRRPFSRRERRRPPPPPTRELVPQNPCARQVHPLELRARSYVSVKEAWLRGALPTGTWTLIRLAGCRSTLDFGSPTLQGGRCRSRHPVPTARTLTTLCQLPAPSPPYSDSSICREQWCV